MPIDFKFGLSWQYGEKKGSFALLHRPFSVGIRDWSPALLSIAEDVLEPHVRQLFDTEGRSETMGWAELAPSTVKRRGSAHPILQVAGDMKLSFQEGSSLHHQEVTPTKLVWGSDVPYAMFHEFGTGGRVDFGKAGARQTIAATKAARERYERSQGQTGGLVPRPMLVYSNRLAGDITSRMRAHVILIARQVGYRILGRGAESPTEALHAGLAELGTGRGLTAALLGQSE